MRKKQGLTNLELAANRTWIVASLFGECPFCSFVSQDTELVRLAAPCPRCGRSGSARSVFPSYSCIERLKAIADSYVRACARVSERQSALVDRISSDLKRTVEPLWVTEAALQVRKLLRGSRGARPEYERVYEALQRALSLQSQEQAARALPSVVKYSDAVTEHSYVVVSTAALFEGLLSDMLVRLLVVRGETESEARKRVRNTRRLCDLEKLFEETAGESLRQAVKPFGVRGSYECWRLIAERRNRFLHNSPGAVGIESAEKAFDLAKNAFGLFAFLHNRYCVTGCASGGVATV